MCCCRFLLTILSATLLACDSKPVMQSQEPVVVYAAYADTTYAPELFGKFTADTGIPVTVRHDVAAVLVEDVIANRGAPPADILLTTNVADIWRAADKGALRPIQSPNLANVSETLKDADRFWVAVNYRLAVIAATIQLGQPQPVDYRDLADPGFRGQVCVVSSQLAISRSLIAMLIAELGARPAELIVRGWVRNLALPPFDTQRQLLAAIKSGACGYGILSDSIVGAGVHVLVPEPAYFDIDGVGIARHAHYPESAQLLVDWLLAEKAVVLSSGVSDRNIGIAGWHDQDALLLAERAGYQ